MRTGEFDCIVVGARCAGAPLGAHLARGGMRVCVVDAAKLPSDQPFSTHAILPLGMDHLDELGVGEQIRRIAPPVRTSRLSVGRAHVDLHLLAGREMYCPRRSKLDPLLVEAAAEAGADIRDETAVLGLLREGDRVVGVRARHGGRTFDMHARLVAGADGRNSLVAKRVGAAEYHAIDMERGGYWAYWPMTKAVESLPFQTYIEILGDEARFLFRTDEDLVIAGALVPIERARTWTKSTERHVRENLAGSPVTRTVLEGGASAVSRFTGLMKLRSFFRVPVGPGWALVGDAGLHKDPAPGYGITDALRDAKALSKAILDGREAALDVYWRERDVHSIALYANATAMGSLDYDNPFNELILSRLEQTPELRGRIQDVIDRKISPFEMVPTWRVFAWLAQGLLGGRTELWSPFLASGKRGTWVSEETKRSQVLLDGARQRLADA